MAMSYTNINGNILNTFFAIIFVFLLTFYRTDLPELQNVGEYSYSYANAEKKEQLSNKNSIGDMISKSSSVIRSIGNKEKKKHRGNDFDQVALISDNDDEDDDDSLTESSKPNKKTKGKKKHKMKLVKKLSDPTSNSKTLSRHEAEQLDGFKPQEQIGSHLDILDPKEGVLHNLKKKHGMYNPSSNRKITRFSESLDDSIPKDVRELKSSRSRARILRNSEIDEAKVNIY